MQDWTAKHAFCVHHNDKKDTFGRNENVNIFKTKTCFHCNGYYGSSYGQPICVTCHLFLYADERLINGNRRLRHDKTDDGDSGNEEPKEVPDSSVCESFALDIETRPCALSLLFKHSSKRFGCEDNDGQSTEDNQINQGENQIPANCLGLPQNLPDHKKTEVDPTLLNPCGVNILVLPPEVMFLIFEKLDEISLWSVGQVCYKWNQLVKFSLNDEWKASTKRRWPMFKPLYIVDNWYTIFTSLIESAPCQLCFFEIPFDPTPLAHENSWRRNRLTGEIRSLKSDPPEGIAASPLDMMSLHWQASIRGPAGSPYQGGTFFLYIRIPPGYPLKPPLVRFITKIFHPNVSRHGDIGIDSIQHNWSLALTISKILISIQSLLTDPFTKVCMEPRIGDIYDNNRTQFERIAKAWTWRYAMYDAIDPDTMVSDYLQHITMSPETLTQNAAQCDSPS